MTWEKMKKRKGKNKTTRNSENEMKNTTKPKLVPKVP